jgi:flagellar biosynthesis protein
MNRKKLSAAAALRYDKEKSSAPSVVASGRGTVADRIVEAAKEANIPIVEDAALVTALLMVELGEEIPPELYQATARILAFVYDLDRRREAEGHGRP